MVYIGSAVFKILKLLAVATFSVHLFACMFYRIKVMSSATDEDVKRFYAERNVDDDVSNEAGIFSGFFCCLLTNVLIGYRI